MRISGGRNGGSILAAAVLACVAAPAVAQPTARSSEPSASTLAQVAGCLVRRDARRSAAFLASAPGESQAGLLADLQGALADCAADVGGEGAELRLSAGALRGPIAEALFKRDFNGWTVRSGRRPVEVYALTPPPAQVPRARLLADMAACVADARPADLLTLFGTTPESSSEQSALTALAPALGPCLRAGQSADVTRSQVRGLLAEAAYRRAAALAGATAAR